LFKNNVEYQGHLKLHVGEKVLT